MPIVLALVRDARVHPTSVDEGHIHSVPAGVVREHAQGFVLPNVIAAFVAVADVCVVDSRRLRYLRLEGALR